MRTTSRTRVARLHLHAHQSNLRYLAWFNLQLFYLDTVELCCYLEYVMETDNISHNEQGVVTHWSQYNNVGYKVEARRCTVYT